ncbi:hypothetical protein BC332_03637 [Capsicum chinense]|nr:hypothetical protein BC332_03637 [Capsicum chinense]
MWKGVKGLWNVIKPCDRLPSYQVESDDEVPTEWSSPEEVEDDAELESDNSPCCGFRENPYLFLCLLFIKLWFLAMVRGMFRPDVILISVRGFVRLLWVGMGSADISVSLGIGIGRLWLGNGGGFQSRLGLRHPTRLGPVSTSCLAKTTLQPKTFFLALEKDPTSLQHTAEIQQRTPLVPIKLSIHLVGDSLWVDCEKGYNSSTYKPSQSKSKQCKLESTTQYADCLIGFVELGPGCNRDACYNIIENPLAEILSRGEILTDLFQQKIWHLLELINRTKCPYDIVRDKKISEYYIKVSSISINGKNVPLNKTLLSLGKKGGTNISTDLPYTMLATSIYNAVTKAFVAAIPKEVRSVPPVEPFTTCFNSRDIRISRLGFNAPEINIGLHKKKVHWTITGANSLVKVNEDVVCLAFVERRTRDWGQAIIIGSIRCRTT